MQIVIPAFNEAQRLPTTLRALRAHVLGDGQRVLGRVEVVVVDNASTDDTAAVARSMDTPGLPIRVIHCAQRGKGAAVRAGMLATDHDMVGFMDADGATGMSALDEAWRLITVGNDMAIGSRALDGSVTMARHSWLRETGAGLFRHLAGRLVPGVQDSQCGFKVMRGELARGVFEVMRTDGFSFDVELLARFRMLGATVAEFPVNWVDVPGSTFVPSRDGAGAFCELAAIAWRLHTGARASVPVGWRSPSISPRPFVEPAIEA